MNANERFKVKVALTPIYKAPLPRVRVSNSGEWLQRLEPTNRPCRSIDVSGESNPKIPMLVSETLCKQCSVKTTQLGGVYPATGGVRERG